MSAYTELAKVCKVEPLQSWPGEKTKKPDISRFDTSWTDTVSLLQREVKHLLLGGSMAVLEVDIPAALFRKDGLPRADARARSRGVVLTIPSKHGPLVYPCDTFVKSRYANSGGEDWQHNARAIALSLEALRKVDRYGVTSRGQQYSGFRQLAAPAGVEPRSPVEVIAEVLGIDPRDVLEETDHASLYRRARRAAHPDSPGGSSGIFLSVQRAIEDLGG